MRIQKDFEVAAPEPETYALLVDLERVARCIPGGEVGPPQDDGSHPASIAVAVGPMRMKYQGRVWITERDDAAGRAVLAADVREQRGQGTAKATMTMFVAASGSGSRVETVTDVKLTGRAAQMGRGVVDDVAARLVAEMAECISAGFSGDSKAADGEEGARASPIKGFRLFLRVLWDRIRRWVAAPEGEAR